MGTDNIQDRIEWSVPVLGNTLHASDRMWERKWNVPNDLLPGFVAFWAEKKHMLTKRGFVFFAGVPGLSKPVLFECKRSKSEFSSIGRQRTSEQDQLLQCPIITVAPQCNYKIKNPTGLREWQIPSVEKLCDTLLGTTRAAIDGSGLGCGKSYCATAVARELNMEIGVVCPKAVVTQWKKVISEHFGMPYSFVINYEQLKTGKYKSIGYWKRLSKNTTRTKFVWTCNKNTLIVFDEAHKLKGNGTQNSEMATEAKRNGYKILCCTGTIATSPLELKTMGFILELYGPGKWWDFLRKNGCDKGRFGWQFNGNQDVLKRLRAEMFLRRGVRLNKNDIPGFPECEIIPQAYDMDELATSEIAAVYAEMNAELESATKVASAREFQQLAMTIQLRARQRTELLKVPLFVDMANEAISEGMSVVIFCNFSATIDALATRLHTKCIVWGNNKGTEREDNIEDFQLGKSRIIIVNTAAGGAGISLHDVNGLNPRLALISPSHSAINIKQSLGRVWRDGSKSKAIQKIVFVNGTVEEQVCESMIRKLDNMDLLNDGDLDPFGLKFAKKA